MLSSIETRHAAIRSYMEETFLFTLGADAREDDNLFELGLVDSYGFVELISHLEKTYGIKFSDGDMTSPQLACYAGILAMVDEKLEAAAR